MASSKSDKSSNQSASKSTSAPSRSTINRIAKNPVFSIIGYIIWTVGCILITQFLLGLLFRFLVQTFHLYSPVIQTIYSVLTYVIAGAIIIFLPTKFTKKTGTTRSELGITGWPTWTDLGLAPIGFIVYAVIAALANSLFTLFPWYNATETQSLGFSQFSMGLDRALAFFTLAIIAPIAEEIIFRGYLYAKLKKSIQSRSKKTNTKKFEIIAIIVASLLTSLVFALLHGQWNVGVNVFFMSLVLCAMREITGTIYAGIIMHMLKNTIAFLLVFVVGLGF